MAYIQGDNFSNDLIGTAFGDTIVGLGGNDTMEGGAGDDGLDGGSGLDWALFAGGVGEYRVGVFSDHVTVNDVTFNGGSDLLFNVERIQFDDLGVAFDLYGNAGAAARLVGTLLGASAVYDPSYMRLFIEAFDAGYTAEQIAGYVIDILTDTNEQLGALIFYNLAQRPGSGAENAYVTDLIYQYGDENLTVAAGYTSYNEANIDFAGLVANGVDFLPII